MNNCLLSSIFSAGYGGFGQMMYWSPERSHQDSWDGIFFRVPRPHFLGRALIWPGCFGEHILGLFELYLSSLSKFVGFVSLSGFYICCYPISTILACLFSVGVHISWKKLCWMRACRRKWHLVFPTLYIIIVDRVNLNKLLQIITKLRWSNKDNNN